MGLSDARAWLVAYDIADPRRLQHIHNYLVRKALAVQYSVFLGVWTERELGRVLSGLSGQIRPSQDDIRAYPLPEWGHPVTRGLPALGQGAFIAGERFRLLREFLGLEENRGEPR